MIEVLNPVSISELLDELREVKDATGAPAPAGRSNVFRGCTLAKYGLEHSLSRLNGDLNVKEVQVLEEFAALGESELTRGGVQISDFLTGMALAQHHGAPTRLLDWSSSHEVALHFATQNRQRMGEPGAVWVASPNIVHEALADGLRIKLFGDDRPDPGPLTQKKFTEQYKEIADWDTHFVPDKYMPTVFFAPTNKDNRMIPQGSLFSIVSDASAHLYDVLEKIPGSCRKIEISPALKFEVREWLDSQKRNECVYFPGLDGIGTYLSRTLAE